MCFMSKPPELKPLPPVPTASDKDVQARAAALQASLKANDGTANTVKTDLSPSDLVGQKRVLLGV
jgi:hypothetical protein